MADKQLKPAAGYRGTLIYSQEEGYKMVSMQVHLYPGEQSSVMSHAYEIPLEHEAEHLTARTPLAGVDLYYFPATDNATNIKLTIESQQERHSAVYSVGGEEGITEFSPYLWLDVLEEGKALDQEQTLQDWQNAFNETIDYYKDKIPVWLEQEPLDTTIPEALHDQSIGLDR